MLHIIINYPPGRAIRAIEVTTTGKEGTYVLGEDKQALNNAPAVFTDNAQPTPLSLTGTLFEFPIVSFGVSINVDASKVAADEHGSIYYLKLEPTA